MSPSRDGRESLTSVRDRIRGRVVVADQLCGSEVRVALDENERDVPLVGDRPEQRGLAGAGRAFEEDVTARRDGREHQAELALPADDAGLDAVPDAC